MTSPRTLLGPLTTTWTPPALCSVYMNLCESCTTGWQAQTCNPSSNAHDWSDCWPPRASSMADPGVMMGWGLYSPGIACPVGYSTAAMATSGGSTGWGIEYQFEEGETAAACCPTGFTCSSIETLNTYAQTCVLTVTSASFSTVQCDSGKFTDFSLITVPRDVNGQHQSQYVLFAPLIQLNFRAGDVPKTSSSPSGTSVPASPGSSPGGASATATQFSSFPVSPTGGPAGASAGSSSSESGLSTGAKVGIGIGAAVGAILLGLILLLLYRARQRRRQTKVIAEGEAARDKMWPHPRQPELGGQEVQELEGGGLIARLSKRRKAGGGPFKVASPSAARGSQPQPPAAGPFELEAADSPAVTTPIRGPGTPVRPQTPVVTHTPVMAPSPVLGPAEPRGPVTPIRAATPDIISPISPSTARLSRESRHNDT